jgi:hypothetical protein
LLACLLVSVPLFAAGFTSGRVPVREGTVTVTEPGIGGNGATGATTAASAFQGITAALGRKADAPSGSATAGLYRGHTAAHWAARFRQRTRQLQNARKALKHTYSYPVYGLHPLERAFMCIHAYEGSWTDPNAPFYGGLQMDLGFQRSYGGWALRAFGTADHWPISVQLSTAIQAYEAGRGFYPWPNTARSCGLL